MRVPFTHGCHHHGRVYLDASRELHSDFAAGHALRSRMVFALGVPLQLLAVEVDLAQVAGGVALGLVVEVLRLGMAAFAAAGDGAGAHARAEFDYRNEAVAAGPVPFLRAGVRPRAE